MLTFTQSVYRFLQLDKLICQNCGAKLDPLRGYYKIAMWPQYAFFTWPWFKQTWFGDNMTMRFCLPNKERDCFKEFTMNGRLGELRK